MEAGFLEMAIYHEELEKKSSPDHSCLFAATDIVIVTGI